MRYFHAKFELLPHQGHKKHTDFYQRSFYILSCAVLQHQESLLPKHVYWGLLLLEDASSWLSKVHIHVL